MQKHSIKSNLKTLDRYADIGNGGMIISKKISGIPSYLRERKNINIIIRSKKSSKKYRRNN